jgi:hypothetical protein
MVASTSRSRELAVVAGSKRVAAAAIAIACAEFLEAPPLFLACCAMAVAMDP